MLTPAEIKAIAKEVATELKAQETKVLVTTKEAAEMVGLDRRSFKAFMASNHILPKHQGNKDLWPYKKIKDLAA